MSLSRLLLSKYDHMPSCSFFHISFSTDERPLILYMSEYLKPVQGQDVFKIGK